MPIWFRVSSNLKDALHSVLVEAKQVCHRPVTKGWVLFDHGLDGAEQLLLDFGRRSGAAVVHRAPGNLQPSAQLDQADHHTVLRQSLLAVTLEEIYTNYGRANEVVNSKKVNGVNQYTLRPGYALRPDLSMDVDNPANLQAMQQTYFDGEPKRPDSFNMGHHGNSDYHTLYAGSALYEVMAAHKQYAPHSRMMLDMKTLGWSEQLIEQNGLIVPTTSHQMPYVDKSTPQMERTFDHTWQPENPKLGHINPNANKYLDNGNPDPNPLPFMQGPAQACNPNPWEGRGKRAVCVHQPLCSPIPDVAHKPPNMRPRSTGARYPRQRINQQPAP